MGGQIRLPRIVMHLKGVFDNRLSGGARKLIALCQTIEIDSAELFEFVFGGEFDSDDGRGRPI